MKIRLRRQPRCGYLLLPVVTAEFPVIQPSSFNPPSSPRILCFPATLHFLFFVIQLRHAKCASMLMNITRNGKIARLPKDIRTKLNPRLQEGERNKAFKVRALDVLLAGQKNEVMAQGFGGGEYGRKMAELLGIINSGSSLEEMGDLLKKFVLPGQTSQAQSSQNKVMNQIKLGI
ncbi:MAG: hypothetical protein ACLQSR_10825 [Limisphaerales bacterium]